MKIREAGPAAWYLDVASGPSPEAALEIGALQRALLESAPAAVRDVIPGYTNILVEFRPGAGRERLERWIAQAAERLEAMGPGRPPARHRVAVRYGEGADVAELEARLGLPWERIAALHGAAAYHVAFLGFTPGFPYLLGLPAELRTPRRETPARQVAAGSVAIAGEHAGIYPTASPGGWWILGRTDARLFDPEAWPPTAWTAGDEVRFVPEGTRQDGDSGQEAGAVQASSVGKEPGPEREPPDRKAPPDRQRTSAGDEPPAHLPVGDPAAPPAVDVLETWPPSASLQAAPRWRVGHFGMAQAGALDPLACELANQAVGNASTAPALEVLQLPLRLRARTPLTAAVAGGGHRARLDGVALPASKAFDWPEGAVLELIPGGRARGATSYLALAGGVAAHRYAGSASTDARSGIGGSRRPLETGDVLALGRGRGGRASAGTAPPPLQPRYPDVVELRIHPGPQYRPGAFRQLTGTAFHVAGFDRTGVRLEGPAVEQPSADVRSEGSPWGAVQLPADGHPIVLLADRGRTGGYAKPAVVDVTDLWRLAQAPLGTEVWLVPGTE